MDRREFGKLTAYAALAPAWQPVGVPAKAVRFSFMLWALAKLAPFDRCVEMVAEAGYQGVELVGEFQKWSPQEKARAMARMRSLGMVFDAMSGVKAGFAVPSDTEAFRAQFVDHLQATKDLECGKVILLSGRRVEEAGASRQRQTCVENLKWAADKAAKDRVEILIEPIDLLENPSIYLSTVTEGFALARDVGSPQVKVLYDFYHEQRSYGNLLEKLEKNIEAVGLVHIADVPGRHEPGTGEVNYAAIYRKLAALGYQQWIAMEYYPTGEPVSSLKKARVDALQAFGS